MSGADRRRRFWPRVAGIHCVLIAANIGARTWALLLFRDQPVLPGTALPAYGLGLRHAVDADHIAAVDTVIRTRMQGGERPVGVGFLFALGHSTVVILAVAAAIGVTALPEVADTFKAMAGLVGTSVSAVILFAVAAANIVILRGIWRTVGQVRRGYAGTDEDVDALVHGRGFLAGMLRPLFRLVTKSWNVFPLGFLFGIGFETASAVALLGIFAVQVMNGGLPCSIMVFPALFTAGMALVGTTAGISMVGAYDWAFSAPIRKLYYDLTITSVSFAIVGLFIAAWVVSFVVYCLGRLDDIPERREIGATGRLDKADLAPGRGAWA